MNEAQLVLRAIHEGLGQSAADIVSPMTLWDDVLELLGGKVELRVEVHHDEGAHPAIAHAHVLATLEGRDERLDASVVAVHEARGTGLGLVGHTFCDLVAGPLLSLVHARPVLGALPFDGNDPIGVRHHQGFVGPLAVRGLSESGPQSVFEGLPSFEFAEALAPPGRLHIAKAVFDVRNDGQIRRTLEVDGQTASHFDAAWRPRGGAPSNIVGLRFAVFHSADQGSLVRHQRALDEAIGAFIEHFAATRDRDAAADRLATSGVDPRIVHELRLFVPAAFARLVFDDRLPLSRTFTRVRADGWTDEQVPFMRERPFARALVLGQRRMEQDSVLAQELAMTSSEVSAINHALNQGSDLANIAPLAPLIPDPDVPYAVLERVAKALYGTSE
ncbi:MAG: hypothetical protein AAGA48_39805 [Myxococcota bacterium]